MKFLRSVLILTVAAMPVLVPVSTSADTISVSQTITITATVAPARSIVVNDDGVMTKIYSNTNEAVTPKVYQNSVPGPELPLTPKLLDQYNEVLNSKKDLNGIEIPVGQPAADPSNVKQLLMRSVSSLLRPAHL